MLRFAMGVEPNITSESEGEEDIRQLFNSLVDSGHHIAAATLILPQTVFQTEPASVVRQFASAKVKDMMLVMGGSSLTKTYSLVVFCYILWLRDPYWTAVKLMSQTEDHLRTNVWSHLLEIHNHNVLKPRAVIDIKSTDLWMGVKGHPESYGFNGMAFSQSRFASSAFFGFKPQPKRPEDDAGFKKFGPMTRLFVLMDEAQQFPESVWTGLNSILGSVGSGRVKVMAAFNPTGVSVPAVMRAEPDNGWTPDQMETLYSYESKAGWWVERIDGKHCENVVEHKEIFPGLMTYERYVGYLKGGGDNSPTYSCFARGFPPLQESVNTVLVPSWVSSQRGEAIYVGKVTSVGAFDAAYQGQDRAVMCIGRWGMATGWRDASGKTTTFKNRLNPGKAQPRHVLTIDQFFTLSKGMDPVAINQELMGRCKMLQIESQWLAMDKMQPVSEPVLTPGGWKKIGEIKIGDYVVGSDGKPTKVIGVYPQKDRRVMKVTMSDGSWTRCGPEHLWSVYYRKEKHPRIYTTEQIARLMKYNRRRFRVPLLSAPVQYYESANKLPIDPYLLGLLLGDGCLGKNSVRFSSVDQEILDSVSLILPRGVIIRHTDRCNYSISSEFNHGKAGQNDLLNSIRSLGLAGTRSHEKFIPDCYMLSSPENRLAILQGLMDTDGFVNTVPGNDKSSCASIRLSSGKMIRQIIQIVESLGGTSTYRTHGTSCNGIPCKNAHVATFNLPGDMERFRLQRKNQQITNRIRPLHRNIINIESEDEEDSVCIRVEANDHLYVTRGCILTHNTGNALATFSYIDKYWGHVLGIGWNEASTETKILTDDLDVCHNRFEGIPTEMWFALKHWLDPVVGSLLFNPTINAPTLYGELTSRRYRVSKGNRLKVESKDEYKARNAGKSPDMADVCIMLVHLLRMRSGITPGIVEQAGHLPPRFPISKPTSDLIDTKDELELGGDDERGPMETDPLQRGL